MMATSGFLTVIECTKFIFDRGSAPDPAGWDHNVSSDPLVVFYAFMLYFAVTMKFCDPHWKSQGIDLESGHPVKHPLCRTPLKFPIGLRHGKTRMMGLPVHRKNSTIVSAVLTQYLRLWQTYIHRLHRMTTQTALCMRRAGKNSFSRNTFPLLTVCIYCISNHLKW